MSAVKPIADFSLLTIEQISERLKTLEFTPELLTCLQHDRRKGVQRLATRIQLHLEKQAKLDQLFKSMLKYEHAYWGQGFQLIAGVDEAGRGPLAGPVVAAAVILTSDFYLPGLNDSKKLTPEQRETFFDQILSQAVGIGLGVVDHLEIDRINILEASFQAMMLAVGELSEKGVEPDYLLVDGDKSIPRLTIRQRPIVGGDGASVSVAAASVVAKVTRDRMMVTYAKKYSGYGFERNKGYGSAEHLAALAKLGPSPIHRQTFSAVKELACNGQEQMA